MSLLKSFIVKSISIPYTGKNWISTLCANLVEAARTESYVETVSNKADTLHKYTSYSEDRYIKRAYELQIKNILKRLNIKKVELAIDTKKDFYYGKYAGLSARNIKPERGAEQAWEYCVISIVWPIRLPLMALHYPMGADLASLSIELLEFARSLKLTIKRVLFDRGFYIAHLIDYLESNKAKMPLPYQILVPRDKAIKGYIEKTKGKIGVFNHQFKYSKNKSKWKPNTTVVICKEVGKNKKGEYYDMVFATNIKPRYSLVKDYKKRWNIETGFRIMEEGKIMSKSNNPITRLFYFLLRALLTAIWLLHNMFKEHYTYKRYLKVVEFEARKFEVYKPPPIKPIY